MSAIPVYRESYLARSGSRRRSRNHGELATAVAFRVALFAVVVAAVYLASSLAGNVMMEKARREGIRAQERALAARKAEIVLQQSIDEMTGLTALNDWALAHGFLAPEQIAGSPQGGTLVASNH